MYFFFNQGQNSNVGRLVPIFAGDQLSFIILASYILSARIVIKPKLYFILAQTAFVLILILSYRRASMAAAIASIIIVVILLMIRNGKGKNLLFVFGLGSVAVLIVGLVLWGTQRSAIESSFLFQRVLSINPIWAGQQTNILLSSMGHNDDFLDGLDLVRQSPILGKGLNTEFDLVRTGNWQTDNLHSTMFSLWVKMGLPGLVFYLFVVTFGIRFFFNGLGNKKLRPVWLVLFVISFSAYNFIITIYSNGVFLGYKNGTCLAIYITGCYYLIKELSSIYAKSINEKDQGSRHEVHDRNPILQSR
jgi:O-antigen ligase